ncbi:MAG: hypothetical protein ACRDZM_10660 [Acidimicrobiia bacterium]
MYMDVYVIVLRLLHILGGVFWAGALFSIVSFVQPTAKRAGMPGGQFVGRLMGEGRFGQAMGGAAIITILSGGLLFARTFGGSAPVSGPMIGFSIGAVAAVVAWLLGFIVLFPAARRMGPLSARIEQGEDVGAEMGRLVATQTRWTQVTAWLVLIAVLTMATARYW